MSENMLDILSTCNLQAQNDMIVLNSILSAKTKFLRRKRRQHLLNIAQLQRKKFLLLQQLLAKVKSKRIWSKTKNTQFWEKDVMQKDDAFFKENFRMSRSTFEILCTEMNGLHKVNTNYRQAIPLNKRVAIALYALASSANYKFIGHRFGVGKSTVYNVLKEFCEEILKVLQPKYMYTYLLRKGVMEVDDNGNGAQSFERYLQKEENTLTDDEMYLKFRYLKQRFGRVDNPINNSADNVSLIIKACCILMVFLNEHSDKSNHNWSQQRFEIRPFSTKESKFDFQSLKKYLGFLEFPETPEEDAPSECKAETVNTGWVSSSEYLHSDSIESS